MFAKGQNQIVESNKEVHGNWAEVQYVRDACPRAPAHLVAVTGVYSGIRREKHRVVRLGAHVPSLQRA